ncbi:MAG: phage integrase N-terminal SAM-like domain-containing protein [Metallibacterium sp.]
MAVQTYSLRTERAYVAWIRQFILSSSKRHPRRMGHPRPSGLRLISRCVPVASRWMTSFAVVKRFPLSRE